MKDLTKAYFVIYTIKGKLHYDFLCKRLKMSYNNGTV